MRAFYYAAYRCRPTLYRADYHTPMGGMLSYYASHEGLCGSDIRLPRPRPSRSSSSNLLPMASHQQVNQPKSKRMNEQIVLEPMHGLPKSYVVSYPVPSTDTFLRSHSKFTSALVLAFLAAAFFSPPTSKAFFNLVMGNAFFFIDVPVVNSALTPRT